MSHYMSDDLVFEIFERLPTKSLVRFRCLSKLWYSRIASPAFIRRHRLRSSQHKVLIRQWDTSSLDNTYFLIIRQLNSSRRDGVLKVKNVYSLHSEEEFPLCHRPGYFDSSTLEFPCQLSRVVNSCNGILCLFDYNESCITLWNPSIRRKLTLPDHPSCNPWSELVFGFGFDPITDDYKIVRISYSNSKFHGAGAIQNSDVYSMKTHTWSSIALPPEFDCMDFWPCFVNGLLHWKAGLFAYSSEDYIISFDISTHAFRRIELPQQKRAVSSKLTIIDGCLGVVSSQNNHCCRIWVMKEYNGIASWYPHFELSFKPREITSLMQLPTNGYYLIKNESHELEVYDPVTKARFILLGSEDKKVYMESCLESLELLDSGELA